MHYLALASDFDGTLAQDGHVDEETLSSIERLRNSGRKLILVTGRELPDLRATFPQMNICDAIVVENGALLYWPSSGEERALAPPPLDSFLMEVRKRGVVPFSVGKVIFATWRPHEAVILQVIQELGLDYQIIFNKRAVMVLPSGINKATGLQAILKEMAIPPDAVVGVGDAENDHAFLDLCGCSVAVANALPAVKEHCHVVTIGDHGRGVTALINQMLTNELQKKKHVPGQIPISDH